MNIDKENENLGIKSEYSDSRLEFIEKSNGRVRFFDEIENDE
jgi:hypothetical protein